MKVRLMIIIGVISFLLGGCNKIQKNSNQVQLVQRTEEILVESEDLADDYFHIYKERWNQSNRNSLKLQQDIIEYLGRKNYIAVDINNQIDMVNGELVKKFCKNVQNEVNDSITIFSIMESGGFVRYDLNSQNGEIYAICSNMTWDQDAPEAEYINEFQVQSWKYTKNGYFFIEEYDRQGYDGYHGKIAVPDPVREAERERYQTLKEYIQKIIVPDMQIKLRQGFGRAIRTETDTCVVSILDSRAGRGGKYHKEVIDALPVCRITDRMADVENFIRNRKRIEYYM